MELASLLQIRPGVTSVIGGGGKTTLLRVLGEELSQQHTVLLCTTTKIRPFPGILWSEQETELIAMKEQSSLLCAGTMLPELGKLSAPKIPMKRLAELFDYVLVEADGAAGHPIKAHASHEPVIPEESNQTICVIGVSGFGKPIAETAHRAELYADLVGADVTDNVSPKTEATLLIRENLHQRVFVNQVEDTSDWEVAKELALLLDCPVVAGSLHKGEYEICSF